MVETPQFGLSLVEAAQAQKHVTVNEAFVRLDALGMLRLGSVTETTPPTLAVDGDCHFVPAGGTNEWFGADGKVAIRSNGGWVFATPQIGWRAWNAETSSISMFDGSAWQDNSAAQSPGGARTVHHVREFDHVIGAGASSTTAAEIRAGWVVTGVTGRVVTAITGALTSWDLGADGSANRYGSGYGLPQNTWVRGITSSPLAYFSDTALTLTAQGGDFSGGVLRVAIHATEIVVPGTV